MKSLFDKTKHTKWYIDEDGVVTSSTTYNRGVDRTKTPNKHQRGYLYVRTTNGNYQVHRLVAKAFIPNPENKPCVNHKDFNRHNNSVKNLEWVTHKENIRYSMYAGRIRLLKKNEGTIKYTNEVCRAVLSLVKSGMKYIEAGEVYGMPYSTVAHLVRGSRRAL